MEGLEALWDEFKVLGTSWSPNTFPLNLHLHAYMHLAQPFHRRGANALHF